MDKNGLPKAPNYKLIDEQIGRIFHRDRLYNLDKISEAEIAVLLEQDPVYWGAKFERIPEPKAKPSKAKGEEALEDA